MKILVTPTSFRKSENDEARLKLEAFADTVIYNTLGRPLQADEIERYAEGIDGYIAGLDYISSDAIERFPVSLKVISRYGAGVDRVDRQALAKKEIVLTNTPGTNAVSVCELAFGMMLAAARHIPALDRAVRNSEWPRSQGIELQGKTLGIVGLGAIGKQLALRAAVFGMRILAYDPYLDQRFIKQHAFSGGSKEQDLDRLLHESDFISLHVPLMDKTRHMIDAAALKKMKDGAVLINTARGGLIDEDVAAAALDSGKLAALCLDAFEEEPPKNNLLTRFDNVIMTPHTGAHTKEAVAGMGMMAVDNLIAVIRGEYCDNIL
ncbi:MAG: phosphoglycerate dehydrogenase [Clostridia bacterium]